ncbi:hypothetical protein QAD02_004335 [Eretmocerus hayati]|uniref:Uncharacterized protein n=1 Tax=Eretmocerus hayati TaxID=131215 RepID=A0ACC2NP94_9HYME|nr:hypothetical protein QAD02_004335 [Eretmocerus hayati]
MDSVRENPQTGKLRPRSRSIDDANAKNKNCRSLYGQGCCALPGCCTLTKSESGEESMRIDTRQYSKYTAEDHCHKERIEDVDEKARKKLIIASILCIIFMIMEIVGGVWSNSLAIATDAAHLLTDFASFMISLFSIWVASRPATRKMPFGWYRAEVIGALTSVLMIWVVTGILLYLAVERIINKDFELDTSVMLITSAVGVAVNIVMDKLGTSLSHSEDGHSSSDLKHKQETNINVRAAFIHVLGDFIQSMGVFIASLVLYFKPSWSIVDPICTFLFSFLVVLTTLAIIKDVVNVLMEGTPRGYDHSQVENTLKELDGVIKVHNLRIWALSLDKTALSAHLAIKKGVSPQSVLRTANKKMNENYDFFEMTLQVEEFNQRMEDCEQCKPPQH